MEPQTSSPLHSAVPAEPPKSQQKPRPSPRRRWLWLFLLALLGASAYFLYPFVNSSLTRAQAQDSATAATGKKGRGSGATPVVAAKTRKGNIGVYITGLGAVTPIHTVAVKSRVDGQLMQVRYKEGQVVHEGDLLIEIDPRPFQVQLQQAEGQLLKDQASLDNAKIDLTRYQKLLAQNAIPEQQLATQGALVKQDEGVVKIDQAQIENAKLNLVYCHIASPISGLVGLRLVDPGNIVHATDNNGLVVITELAPISVIFPIPEDQLPPVLQKMHAGRQLRVEAWDRDLKKKLAQGTLATLDNEIDQTTGTLKLRAVFDNKDDSLYPNQFVNARLLVEEKYGAVLAPNAAIQRSTQSVYVWVVKPDQTVTVRTVTTGTSEGDDTEVSKGLAAGEVVVIDGVDKLQEGGKVTPSFAGQQQSGNHGNRSGSGERKTS